MNREEYIMDERMKKRRNDDNRREENSYNCIEENRARFHAKRTYIPAISKFPRSLCICAKFNFASLNFGSYSSDFL